METLHTVLVYGVCDRPSLSLQCVNAGMDTLTLARFICELSLMEMQFVPVRASLLASACLLIALVTKDLGGWVCVHLFVYTIMDHMNYPVYLHNMQLCLDYFYLHKLSSVFSSCK